MSTTVHSVIPINYNNTF